MKNDEATKIVYIIGTLIWNILVMGTCTYLVFWKNEHWLLYVGGIIFSGDLRRLDNTGES